MVVEQQTVQLVVQLWELTKILRKHCKWSALEGAPVDVEALQARPSLVRLACNHYQSKAFWCILMSGQ